MTGFAKLYDFDDIGQVLVKVDDGEENAEVRIYFKPKGLGVCSVAMNFKPDGREDDWDKAQKAFAMIDERRAYDLVTDTLKTIPAGMPAPPE